MTRTAADRHDEFPAVSYEAWRAKVEAELRGDSFAKRLVTPTAEGIDVQPLYVRAGEAPGEAPFRPRLSAAAPARWQMWHEVRDADPRIAAGSIEAAVALGADGVWLTFDGATARALDRDDPAARPWAGRDGISVSSFADLETLLAAVDLARTGVVLDGGAGSFALSEFLWGLLDARGGDPSGLRGCAGLDPLGTLAETGSFPGSIEAAFDAVMRTARRWGTRAPGFRAALISSAAVHDAGGSATDEVAVALATGLAVVRRLVASGFALDAACAQLAFAFAVGNDLFMEIAKLRAFRRLWTSLLVASGVPAEKHAVWIHARTSGRTLTRWDPWSNLLRGTTQAFGAAIGGADCVTVLPYDRAAAWSDALALRLALGTQLVLAEESHLDRTLDPAAGSWYVEALTEALARAVWNEVRRIDSAGGIESEISRGALQERLASARAKRADDTARKVNVIVGINEFASAGDAPPTRPVEASPRAPRPVEGARLSARTAWQLASSRPASTMPLRPAREAAPFERLRDAVLLQARAKGRAPLAFLANLGALSEHHDRASFATNALAAGGIAAIERGGHETATGVVDAFGSANCEIAVICGADEHYATALPAAATGLKRRGARVVVVSGRPGPNETPWRAAGVDLFLYPGCDLLVTLGAILSAVGVSLPHSTASEGLR